ncbi:sensor histidine kinase [Streptomyces sp. NPDC091377]|uniref:sensor histidine kinase n=1 Tax=Streptomyces sp. NPDC091377 TaxID=3365995 RepID=UPI00381A94FB
MSETTRRVPSPPDGGVGAYKRSPEYRVAADALRGLRQDLFKDAFAYRPMRPMRLNGVFTRRLKGRPREYAKYAPHAVVAVAGLIAFAVGWNSGANGPFPLLLAGGLLCAVPVLVTLVRPVGAFWLSMASAPLGLALSGGWFEWPWAGGTIFSHVVVLTVVAIRTRPRTAVWLWALTALYSFLATVPTSETGVLGPVLLVAALSLLTVTVWHIRRDAKEAKEEVTAQKTVTEHERSKRTLLEERTTIARELHDVVAHHMSVVAIQAEAAPYRVENPPPELERAFVTIRENAVAALTELRRVLGVVRAEDYEAPDAPQPTLGDLDRLLANVRDTGLDVEKTVTGAVRELPQGVELSAYRIVQEALSNTLRHAPGAPARVEVGYVLGGLGLRIVNDPPPHPSLIKPSPGAGHGITGMRERVTMLSGEMTAGTADDGGYEVAVFLPVARVNEGE